MSEDKLKLMRQMTDRLNEAADAYYNGRQELMTDYEWDALFDELKKLEEETGTVLEDSPTMNVSADQIAGAKEPHEFAALSLAKTKKPEDLVKWAEGRKIWLSWKLDGLTLVVTYDNGRLRKVVTRGDGHIGTNITHLAPAIQGILPKIDYPGHLVIRGEAVISYEDFEKFRMESGEDYANPRNLASGSLSLKDVNEVRKREIHWLPFTLVHTDEEIISALKTACAFDFISELPNGINGRLGERGRGISEGQAQRISIARALLRNSPILLLDEATSALDVETESRVLTNIIKAHPNKVIIVSTHRPSALKLCRHIYRIENGGMVEVDIKEALNLIWQYADMPVGSKKGNTPVTKPSMPFTQGAEDDILKNENNDGWWN